MIDSDLSFFLGLSVGFILGAGVLYFGALRVLRHAAMSHYSARAEYRKLLRELEELDWRERH